MRKKKGTPRLGWFHKYKYQNLPLFLRSFLVYIKACLSNNLSSHFPFHIVNFLKRKKKYLTLENFQNKRELLFPLFWKPPHMCQQLWHTEILFHRCNPYVPRLN